MKFSQSKKPIADTFKLKKKKKKAFGELAEST
jgi:hypothetical protein